MTDKRFELVWTDTGEVLHDNETGLDKGIYSPDYRFHVRDMMNELADENKQLKSELEESKKAHSNCDKLWWELHDEKEQLEKENEELKQQIKELYNFVKCDVDNEIDVYPKSILEYLVNILKIIGDVE